MIAVATVVDIFVLALDPMIFCVTGFATFVFILAFFVMTSAAIYISPLINGSANEKKVLRAPQEIDTGTAVVHRNTLCLPPLPHEQQLIFPC